MTEPKANTVTNNRAVIVAKIGGHIAGIEYAGKMLTPDKDGFIIHELPPNP